MVCRSLVATEQFRLAANSHSAYGSVCVPLDFLHSQSLTFSKALEYISDAKLWRCSSLGVVNTSVLQPPEFLSFDSFNP